MITKHCDVRQRSALNKEVMAQSRHFLPRGRKFLRWMMQKTY